MVRKIGVIGMGNVGSAVAHHIVSTGMSDELILIDPNQKKVEADALDFQDAMANLPFYTPITINSYDALADADVIISALGDILLQDNPDDDRFAELPFTSKQATLVAEELKRIAFSGILVVISNPVDVVTSIYQTVTGLPKERVIGTGTLLDSARMKRAVSTELHLDPRSVIGYNLGEHGNSQFTAWSTVRVLGKPIDQYLEDNHLSIDLDALDHESKAGGHRVFHGKKYTNYGIATAAIALTQAIFTDAHTEMPVSNYREEYGVYLSYPAVVGRNGIVQQAQLNLTPEELDKLQISCDYIKTKYLEVFPE